MSPRPPNPDTREKLLDAAEKLMLEKGFSATGLDELCRESGLSKGSLFHYFRSKDELAAALLDRFGAARMGALLAASFDPEKAPRERVLGYLDLMIAKAGEPQVLQGCLFGALGLELPDSRAEVKAAVARGFETWTSVLEAELEGARRIHAAGASWAPRAVAQQIIAVFEGSLLLVKATGERGILARNLRQLRDYVESLFA
jgi:TetR/AcrR family transcriptional repressor of nem operon